MNCIVCGGQVKQTDPRSWDCLECGAELYRGNDGEIAVVGNHSIDDEDGDESLSVWDAADIYLSHGCDEDYRFGYTHEELMRASGNS